MYNVDLIKAGFENLVGVRQNVDPDGWQLTALTTSSSGLWLDGVHPLLTIDNLISIAPEFDLIDPAQVAINTAFTAWLKNKLEDSTIKAIQDWITSKAKLRTSNNLLSNPKIYNGAGSIFDTITSTGRIVGREFIPIREKSITLTIRKIGLQLSANQSLDIKLFDSENTSPLETETIVYIGEGSVQWLDVNWTLEGGKTYWVAYDQDDLTGDAINGVYDHTAINHGVIKQPNDKYFFSTPFNVDAVDVSSVWDIKDNQHTVSENYGLNFDVCVECDYTQFVIDQKDLFKDIVWLRQGMDLLRELMYNPESRINRNESNIDRLDVRYELDGDSQGRAEFSVNGRYRAALEAIQLDTTGISKVCLPCRRRGVRFKSLG